MVRVILAIVVIVLTGYNRITETELVPYYMFFLGALILVTGLSELQKRLLGTNEHCYLFIYFLCFHTGFLTELSGQVGSLRNGTI